MRREFRPPVFLLVLLLAAPLAGEERPPAPEGFSWKTIDSVKAAFLVPKGWHFLEETHGDTHSFFISEEDIGVVGEFRTGLTVNVQRLKRESATSYAKLFIENLSAIGKVQERWQSEEGVMRLYGARIHVTGDPPPFTEHVLAIGNGRTNTIYTIIFESPDLLWDQA